MVTDRHIQTPVFTSKNVCSFTGKERDAETGYSYFGARYYDSDLSGLFLSVDPMADKYPSISPYHYCHWNPIYLIDSDGKKDRPFRHGIDKPKTFIENTSTPTTLIFGGIKYANTNAYNCHSYAWHGGKGDPTPAPGDTRKVLGIVLPKWDNSPADDIIEKNAQQLTPNENNIPGDIVIYYMDSDGSGMYENGEEIIHSAVVVEVDDEGYTTVVRAKCGESMISENHPDAPYYYDRYKGTKPSRAYFRIPEKKDDSTNE